MLTNQVYKVGEVFACKLYGQSKLPLVLTSNSSKPNSSKVTIHDELIKVRYFILFLFFTAARL